MFDTLSDKLQVALGELRGRGVHREKDLSRALAQDPVALLDTDIDFKVVKEFVAEVKDRAGPRTMPVR